MTWEKSFNRFTVLVSKCEMSCLIKSMVFNLCSEGTARFPAETGKSSVSSLVLEEQEHFNSFYTLDFYEM